MIPSVQLLCLASLLITCCCAQSQNEQTAEEQAKLFGQKQYFGYPLSRAFQTNRGAQQFTPVTEDQAASKEQQFFNNAQGRQDNPSQDAQQLQEQQNALLQQQYLQYAQQQYLAQQPAAGRLAQQQQQYLAQQPAAARLPQQQQQSLQEQQYKAAEQYQNLLGVRFSAANTVAKTQFSGNGFSYSY